MGYAIIRVSQELIPNFWTDGGRFAYSVEQGLPADAELIAIIPDPSIPRCWQFTFRSESLPNGLEPVAVRPTLRQHLVPGFNGDDVLLDLPGEK